QAGLIANLSGTGLANFYSVQGNLVRQIDGTGAINWTYTSSEFGVGAFNFYAIDAGYITSLATKQLVVCSAPGSGGSGSSQCGLLTVIDSGGNLVWNKILPFRLNSVCIGDVNADGYGEVIATWGATPTGSFTTTKNGGVIIFDRNGTELMAGSESGASPKMCFGSYDGSSTPAFQLATNDRRLLRYKCDSAQGAAVKITVPSVITDSTTQTLFFGASGNST